MRVEAAVEIEAEEGAGGVGRVLELKNTLRRSASRGDLGKAVRRRRDRDRHGGAAGSLCRLQLGRRAAVHAGAAERDRDRRRQGRPATARPCDRRPRGARHARRLRGGAEGERPARQPPPDHPSRADRPGRHPALQAARRAGQHPGAVGLSRHLYRRPDRAEDRAAALGMALSVRRAEAGRRDAGRLQRLERVVDEPAGGDPDRRDPPGHRRRQTAAC